MGPRSGGRSPHSRSGRRAGCMVYGEAMIKRNVNATQWWSLPGGICVADNASLVLQMILSAQSLPWERCMPRSNYTVSRSICTWARVALGWAGESRAALGWAGEGRVALGWAGELRAAWGRVGEERAAWGWAAAWKEALGWVGEARAAWGWADVWKAVWGWVGEARVACGQEAEGRAVWGWADVWKAAWGWVAWERVAWVGVAAVCTMQRVGSTSFRGLGAPRGSGGTESRHGHFIQQQTCVNGPCSRLAVPQLTTVLQCEWQRRPNHAHPAIRTVKGALGWLDPPGLVAKARHV